MTEPSLDLTSLLNRWKSGDKSAESALIEALYPILKRSAHGALGKCAPGRLSLSATELVHETYLRLIQQRNGFENRAHLGKRGHPGLKPKMPAALKPLAFPSVSAKSAKNTSQKQIQTQHTQPLTRQ